MISALLKPLIGPILDKLVDRIPDPNARAEAREQAESDLLKVVSDNIQGQLDINKVEAAHKSVFVAGWRPFIGWVCGVGLAWEFLGQPIALWVIAYQQIEMGLPSVASEHLMELTLGMLGIAGLRSFEKLRGVAREK